MPFQQLSADAVRQAHLPCGCACVRAPISCSQNQVVHGGGPEPFRCWPLLSGPLGTLIFLQEAQWRALLIRSTSTTLLPSWPLSRLGLG